MRLWRQWRRQRQHGVISSLADYHGVATSMYQRWQRESYTAALKIGVKSLAAQLAKYGVSAAWRAWRRQRQTAGSMARKRGIGVAAKAAASAALESG